MSVGAKDSFSAILGRGDPIASGDPDVEELWMNRFQPDGRHTVIPRIIVREPKALIGFMTAVFGAEGELHENRPAEMRIGDSVVIVSDGGGLRESIPAFLYVYVENVDATYRSALQAGAESLEVPTEMPYGDRRGMVKDAWGNLWQIATHH